MVRWKSFSGKTPIGRNVYYRQRSIYSYMISSAGREIVYVFFVLSGFFISLSLCNNNCSTKKFLSIRLTRVYIPLLVSIIISFLLFILVIEISPQIFNLEYFVNQELLAAREELNFKTLSKTLLLLKTIKFSLLITFFIGS